MRSLVFAATAHVLLCAHALGQQFQDQTAARFPQPDLLEYTNQATIGDIDGDGDLDLIFANGGNVSTPGLPQKLRVFINNGAGVFTDETDARTGGLVFIARHAELGDIERDGDLDIIVAQDFNAQPALLVNNGSGVFTNETLTRLPIGTFSSNRVQFADIENDGDLDLYFVNGGLVNRFGSSRGKLWRNNGLGVFSDATTTNTPNQNTAEPVDCIFGDIDGDYDLDLRIASTANNQSRLFRNNGLGVFQNVTGLPPDQNCESYEFGDINGDTDLDLLGVNGAAAGTNAEILLGNNGSGAFTALAFTGSTIDDGDAEFLDYDGDGDLDIVVASLGVEERAYVNDGSGVFALDAGRIQSIADSSLDMKIADLDADGRYDLVTAQGESGNLANRVYINTSGPVDAVAPSVVRTEQIADASGNGPFVVRAVVYDDHTSDRGFFPQSVTLHYSVGGSNAQTTPMQWSGNSVWRGVIPAQNVSGVLEYFVTAVDAPGNTGFGLDKSFEFQVPCPADTNGDNVVNVDDLIAVIAQWGEQTTTHDVGVTDFDFVPDMVNARAGDSIHWFWVQGFHTVTSGSSCTASGPFNVPLTAAAPSFTYVLPSGSDADVPYFCVPHCAGGMVGNVLVEPFPGNVNGDTIVDVNDLTALIGAWGGCP